MQSVNIRTTQNVAIDYKLAGVVDRIVATLIDLAIMVAYVILIVQILQVIRLDSVWIGLSFFLPVFLYHLISEMAMGGQSLGKKAVDIKVVRLDGTQPTIGNYILRWILRPVDIGIFSGAIAILSITIGGKGQRLGDMAAGTTVVKLAAPKAVSSHDVLRSIDKEYDPAFKNVVELSEQDIEIIREALKANRVYANKAPAIAATEKVKTRLNIQTDLPPVKFLHTIVKDFNYLTSRE